MVLEEAAREAVERPVARTPAHRLALAWLTLMDFAPTRQADAFWRILGHAGDYAGDEAGKFRRSSDGPMFLRGWRRRAGRR